LIVSAKEAGTAYALKNIGTGTSQNVSLQVTSAVSLVKIIDGSPVFIRTNDSSIVWEATENSEKTGFYLSNDGNYLRLSSSTTGSSANQLRAYNSNSTSVYWNYTSSDNHLKYSGNSGRNLRYHDTNKYYTTSSSTSSSDYKVYIFEKVIQEVPATGISLNKDSLDMVSGDTETLTATLEPEDATSTVTWSTDDDTVATVENGVVTAVGAGTATITAETANGKKATCAVSVTAAPDV
jgi:hypothetical protein